MPAFAARSAQAELMDGAEVTPAEFAACLASLARVNRVTLARRPTLAWLARATAGLPRGSSFTLLDVGFGEGDMLRAVAAWARRRGLAARLAGVDLNPRSAPVARGRTDPTLEIDYRTGDAFADPRPVDFVISSLTAHHMTDAELVRFLAWMEATATRGWFVNDLHRHPIAYHGIRLIAWAGRFHPFVRHDGPVSVARSFRRADWVRLLAAAGVPPGAARIVWRFPFRLCVGRIR